MFHSLKSKLIAALCGIALFSMVITFVVASALLWKSHRDAVQGQLQASGTSLMSLGISDFSELADFQAFNAFIENALQMDRVDKIIRIFDANRKIIFTTVGSAYDRLPGTLEKVVSKPTFLTLKGEKQTYESLVIPYEARGRSFYLQIVIPLPHYEEILGSLWGPALVSFGLLLSVAIGLSLLLTSRLLWPVRLIAEHLQKLDPSHVEQWKPLEITSMGQYLGPIAQGINLLIRKTQTAMFRLKKMARYVAHELRTPLTIIQGEAESTLMKKNVSSQDYVNVLKSSLEEVQKMSEIISSVLGVAEEKETPVEVNFQKLDISVWLKEQIPQWKKSLQRPVLFRTEGGKKEPLVRTDPELLFCLVDNLVRNVKKHTPSVSPCILQLEQNGKGAVLHIMDEGPGLPDPLLKTLNNPEEEILVEGVGLHLCRRIAEVCKLQLQFVNLAERGLKVSVWFPTQSL